MSEDQVRGKDGKSHSLTDREEHVLADLAEGRGCSYTKRTGPAIDRLLRMGLIEPEQGWRLSPRGTQVATILAQRAAAMR